MLWSVIFLGFQKRICTVSPCSELSLIQQYYVEEVDTKKLITGAIKGMLRELDPHTSYMSPRTLREFDISMRLKLEGIGAALKVEDGYTTVNSIVPGGAAALDGIKLYRVNAQKRRIVALVPSQ